MVIIYDTFFFICALPSIFYSYIIGRMSEEDLTPELGDLITIKSHKYGSVTGRIIYRSESLLRVKPNRAIGGQLYEFPLDPTTGLFQESLGVEELESHEKQKDPAFVTHLGILPGMTLELIRADRSSEKVLIKQILTETDSLVVDHNGVEEQLDFHFIGPQPPYVSVEVMIPEAEPELIATSEPTAVAASEEFDISQLVSPGAVEEIPSAEKLYSSEDQVEDMNIY